MIDNQRKYSVGFYITNRCNKNCTHCVRNVTELEPADMSPSDGYREMSFFKPMRKNISRIIFTGGEPFINRHLKDLITIAQTMFPEIPINIFTNGRLAVDRLQLLSPTVSFHVQHYPGWNDDEINELKQYKYVKINRFLGFRDFNEAVEVDEVEAKSRFLRCQNNRAREIRLVYGKLYHCCNAESVEGRNTPKIFHVPAIGNVIEQMDKLRNEVAWKACMNCPVYDTERNLGHE